MDLFFVDRRFPSQDLLGCCLNLFCSFWYCTLNLLALDRETADCRFAAGGNELEHVLRTRSTTPLELELERLRSVKGQGSRTGLRYWCLIVSFPEAVESGTANISKRGRAITVHTRPFHCSLTFIHPFSSLHSKAHHHSYQFTVPSWSST